MSNKAYIQQTIEWTEYITYYEVPNRYAVLTKNSNDPYTMLFFSKEMSSCCERNCNSPQKPFKLCLKHITDKNFDHNYYNDNFAVFDKPYSCGCFCLCRPEMVAHYRSKEGSRFGKILFPSSCDPVFYITSTTGAIIYSVKGECCSQGYICGDCCGECCDCFGEVRFNIYNGKYRDDGSKSIGEMTKKKMGLKNLKNNDNFEIKFPLGSSAEEKLLLIGVGIYLEHNVFRENINRN